MQLNTQPSEPASFAALHAVLLALKTFLFTTDASSALEVLLTYLHCTMWSRLTGLNKPCPSLELELN